MQKIFWILLAGIILLMPACLTIEERYTFKKDGSGDAEYIIDMSEMASLIKMAQEEEGVGNMEDELDISIFSDKLAGIAGISKVKALETDVEFVFGVQFHFDGISSLNVALNALNKSEEMMGTEDHEYFKMDGKTITRTHRMSDAFDLNELLEGGEGEEGEAEQMAMLMESMKFKLTMTFKKPIKSVYTSADSRFLDKKNKQVEIVATVKQVMDDPSVLNATIKTK